VILFPSSGCLCRDGADEDDGPSSSGSLQGSRQEAGGKRGNRSPAEADHEKPSGDQERELNPYSSMRGEDIEKGNLGLMDRVCLSPKAIADQSCKSSSVLPTGVLAHAIRELEKI
jgi:hypothetical protein